jgi:hypothetical protein
MMDRSADALAQLCQAVDALEARGMGLFISFSYGCLAEALEASGQLARARDYASRALERAKKRDPLGEASALRTLARCAAAEHGRDSVACDHYLRLAMQSAHARESRREVALTLLASAQLGSDPCTVRTHARRALHTLRDMGMVWYAEHAENIVSC